MHLFFFFFTVLWYFWRVSSVHSQKRRGYGTLMPVARERGIANGGPTEIQPRSGDEGDGAEIIFASAPPHKEVRKWLTTKPTLSSTAPF